MFWEEMGIFIDMYKAGLNTTGKGMEEFGSFGNTPCAPHHLPYHGHTCRSRFSPEACAPCSGHLSFPPDAVLLAADALFSTSYFIIL